MVVVVVVVVVVVGVVVVVVVVAVGASLIAIPFAFQDDAPIAMEPVTMSAEFDEDRIL